VAKRLLLLFVPATLLALASLLLATLIGCTGLVAALSLLLLIHLLRTGLIAGLVLLLALCTGLIAALSLLLLVHVLTADGLFGGRRAATLSLIAATDAGRQALLVLLAGATLLRRALARIALARIVLVVGHVRISTLSA
jgi:hypothetical protein